MARASSSAYSRRKSALRYRLTPTARTHSTDGPDAAGPAVADTVEWRARGTSTPAGCDTTQTRTRPVTTHAPATANRLPAVIRPLRAGIVLLQGPVANSTPPQGDAARLAKFAALRPRVELALRACNKSAQQCVPGNGI